MELIFQRGKLDSGVSWRWMLSEDRCELKDLGTLCFLSFYVFYLFLFVCFILKILKRFLFYFCILKYLKDFVVLGMEFGALSMLGKCTLLSCILTPGSILNRALGNPQYHWGWWYLSWKVNLYTTCVNLRCLVRDILGVGNGRCRAGGCEPLRSRNSSSLVPWMTEG